MSIIENKMIDKLLDIKNKITELEYEYEYDNLIDTLGYDLEVCDICKGEGYTTTCLGRDYDEPEGVYINSTDKCTKCYKGYVLKEVNLNNNNN